MAGSTDAGLLISFTGLTVVVNPPQPLLDIAFVHGFTGHPERTWVHKTNHDSDTSDKSRFGKRIQKIFSSKRQINENTQENAVFWPRDLVPGVVPEARVLTYGYDTKIRHRSGPPLSTHTVYDIGGDFLIALEAERRDAPERPIFFVAHSLGGIVVKEMLRRSNTSTGQPHLDTIWRSTKGAMFFGTPHSGADPRGTLLHVAEAVYRALGYSVNQQIVNSLLPSSERLRELRDSFNTISQQRGWIIHSFQEQYKPRQLNRKIVEDTSSCLGVPTIETTEHIGHDHMSMCRFSGYDDPEFRKVAAALRRMTASTTSQEPQSLQSSEVTRPAAMTQEPSNTLSPVAAKNREQLLEALRFDHMGFRLLNIRKAHNQTCQWLLRKPEYLAWLDPAQRHRHHGFMWIKGHPGLGKSTLMKFAFDEACSSMQNTVIVSFFFNARGTDMEKSTQGMYRSLLSQLLEKHPDIQLGSNFLQPQGKFIWTVELLKSLFEQVIRALGRSSVVFFIDALDECEESEIRDMISFFSQISDTAVASNTRLRLCFSSRHYPHITVKYGLQLVVEAQKEHGQDIANYVESELMIGNSELADEIRSKLRRKASGVFMWVVLVVDMLNREHDKGRMDLLRQRLEDLPNDLLELFREIFIRDSKNDEETLLCIQWTLFARQPLTQEDLYTALVIGANWQLHPRTRQDLYLALITRGSHQPTASAIDPELSNDDIRRYILNCSKGLIELMEGPWSTVQFVHESVRDFLLKKKGLIEIWPKLGDHYIGQSHDRLRSYYMHLLWLYRDHQIQSDDDFPYFLDGAVRDILYHAEIAEREGVSQVDFLHNFPLHDWIRLYNERPRDLKSQNETPEYAADASLLFVLAEQGLLHLVRTQPLALHSIQEERREGWTPFLVALTSGREAIVEEFSRALISSLPVSDETKTRWEYFVFGRRRPRDPLYHQYRHPPMVGTWLERIASECDDATLALILSANQAFHPEHKALESNVIYGRPIVVQILLEINDIAPGEHRALSRSLFLHAVDRGALVLIQHFIALGSVDLDVTRPLGRQAIFSAVGRGYVDIVRDLVNAGAMENCTDPRSILITDNDDVRNLLHLVIESADANNAMEIGKILIETGKVSLDFRDIRGYTPLHLAVIYGHEALVKLLLDSGEVDMNVKDGLGWTLMHSAAHFFKDEAILALLIATGKVDLDAVSEDGETILDVVEDEEPRRRIEKLLKDARHCRQQL